MHKTALRIAAPLAIGGIAILSTRQNLQNPFTPSSTALSESAPEHSPNLARWTQKWVKSETRWHYTNTHHTLIKYKHLLPSRGKILVPLCGKTVDLLYFPNQEVLGVEGVKKAITEFGAEQSAFFPTGFDSEKDTKENANFETYTGKTETSEISLLRGGTNIIEE